MKWRNHIIGMLTLFCCFSCHSDAIFDKNIPIENNNWKYDLKPTFDVHITDNSKKHDIFFNVRHTANYPYANFFVLIYQKAAKSKVYIYQKELKFADADGKWTGTSAGSRYTQQSLIQKDYVFPDTGLYSFSFMQNMRDNPLKEITDIGLKIIAK